MSMIPASDQKIKGTFEIIFSATSYSKLIENKAQTTEISLAKDRIVESTFEKKTCPIENTCKM